MPGMLTMMAQDGLGHYQDHSQLFDSQQTRQNGQLHLRKGVANTQGGFLAADVLEAKHVDNALLALAHQEYKQGSYQDAMDHVAHVRIRDPKRTDALLLQGAIHYQLHNFDACIDLNQEAIRLDPNFAEAYGNLANALKEKGDLDLAIQYYLVAIQLRPSFCDAYNNLASAYMKKGMLIEAAACCQYALHLNPELADAHSNLGNLLKAQGLAHHAYFCYLEALKIQPTFAIAWSNLAGICMEWGDLQRALAYYEEAVRLKPKFADAHCNMGNVLKAMNRTQEAVAAYHQAIRLRPDFAIAHGNLASIYYEQGQLEQAIATYRDAILLEPAFVEAYNNLGNALKDAGRIDEAITCYQNSLALQPNHPQALTNLGNIYMEWNMPNEALSLYKQTITVTTGLSAPYNNLATIYKQQGCYADAIACYNEVLRIDNLAADGLVNRGNTLKEMGRVSEAIQDYLRAVTVRPTMAEAHANLASAYKDSGVTELAIQSYRHALLLRPNFPEAFCNLLHTLQCVCDWDDRDNQFVQLEKVIRQQIEIRVLPSVQPFHAIAYPLDSGLALEISRKYAEHCQLVAARFNLAPFEHPPAIPPRAPGGSGRLRVGYVSSDFGNHPLSHLMGSVFGLHNRDEIEVFCYALSVNDGSEWRQRISSEAEHFFDVSATPSEQIAAQIAEDQIQVLVNLNGYTKGARNEIFALRPAPIQVSYMGFPGTTGAEYIDYLVTDEFVSPFESAHIYSEKIVHLPHCYFVNDYKQSNRDVLDPQYALKRSDYGLPEDKFLFCCFNQLYKMDPQIFGRWCSILKRVPNSALWLLRFPAAGESRLKSWAVSHGVQPDQIIFTDVAGKSEHIRRSALADLFLDTPLCNAHTTGTDVLWAGCPIVTLPLEKMATRVAGSLCISAGCGEEMVVSSWDEYEETAVMYATNPAKLRSVTEKLRAGRLTCPLFDTKRWVRNMDTALKKMWRRHCDGKPVDHFKVFENERVFDYEKAAAGVSPSTTGFVKSLPESVYYSLAGPTSLVGRSAFESPPSNLLQQSGSKRGFDDCSASQREPPGEVTGGRTVSTSNLQLSIGGSYYGAVGEGQETGVLRRERFAQDEGVNRQFADRGGPTTEQQRQTLAYPRLQDFAGVGGASTSELWQASEGAVGSGGASGFRVLEAGNLRRVPGVTEGSTLKGTSFRGVDLGQGTTVRDHGRTVGERQTGRFYAALQNGRLPSGYHIDGGPSVSRHRGSEATPLVQTDGLSNGSNITWAALEGSQAVADWGLGSEIRGSGQLTRVGSKGEQKALGPQRRDVRGGSANAPIEVETLREEIGTADAPIEIGDKEETGALMWENGARGTLCAPRSRGCTVYNLQNDRSRGESVIAREYTSGI